MAAILWFSNVSSITARTCSVLRGRLPNTQPPNGQRCSLTHTRRWTVIHQGPFHWYPVESVLFTELHTNTCHVVFQGYTRICIPKSLPWIPSVCLVRESSGMVYKFWFVAAGDIYRLGSCDWTLTLTQLTEQRKPGARTETDLLRWGRGKRHVRMGILMTQALREKEGEMNFM